MNEQILRTCEFSATNAARQPQQPDRKTQGDETMNLVDYATQRIVDLNLDETGPLGTESVVAYDDADEGKVRISDGHYEVICATNEEVDQQLQVWVDWIDED
jgi:hypothetical protein